MGSASVVILLLAALPLVCLAGASPGLAYYPPLQDVTGPTVSCASCHNADTTVTVSVHNPATGQDISHTWTLTEAAPIVVDQISKSQGIVAWRVIVQDIFWLYKIVWGVYDPGRALPNNPEAGWVFVESPWISYETNILALNDGMLLYETKYQDGEGRWYTTDVWCTYDPTPPAAPDQEVLYGWKSHVVSFNDWPPPENHVVKDGLAAYINTWPGGSQEVRCFLYDVSQHDWFYISVSTLFPTAPAIVDATVTWTDDSGDRKLGYDHTDQAWHSDFDTLIFPYFVFAPLQPRVGQPVWFTDLSFAATSWNWDLGEGLPNTSRSLYHIYAKPGNYEVYQTAEGPTGWDFYGRTVPVMGSAIAPLMLLLGN
jgi:hypothetical protein